MSNDTYYISIPTGNGVTGLKEPSHHIPVYQWRYIIDELRNKRLEKNHPTVVPANSRKSDSFEPLFDAIKNVLNNKNNQYSIDPISILSLDDLLTQIKIKAVRAELAITSEKRTDELMDIIVYALLTLNKVKFNPEESHV